MVFWLDSLFAFWYQKSVTSQAAGGLFLLYLVLAFYYTLFCQLHFLIELLKITCEWQVTASCQTNTFPKHIYVSQAYISNVTNNNKKRTLKNRQVNKFSKTTIVQNPVQSPSCLSTRSCYLYPTFMFWSVIFMVHSDWWRLLLLEFW